MRATCRAVLGALGVTACGWANGSVALGVRAASAARLDPTAWTVYHHDLAGSGLVPSVSRIDTTTRAWTSPQLDGQIFGEPLGASGRVYVATENDTVYALSSANGAIVWSTHLGTPVPSGSLPCGNISPTVGITGTPVVDQPRSEIFAVADERIRGNPAHMLVGLSTSSGRVVMTRKVDPAGADPGALLQRTGLSLDSGRVIFGVGGNYGDCKAYRGSVVAVPESGGTPARFTVDAAAGESQGAIWMGGAAPAVDGAGHIWVAVGNGSVTSTSGPYDHSDSVLELSSSLRLLQYFAPSTWASDNGSDLDMSSEPALLPSGQVVEAGKSRVAYLLQRSHLGGIGGQEAGLSSVCGADVAGGMAVAATIVYLPCLSGVVALKVASAPASLHVLWSSHVGGGPPIIAAGRIWTIGQDGILYGLSPETGVVGQQAAVGTSANHFPTPSVADGLLLAASADHVVAFKASSTRRSTSPTTTVKSSSAGATASSTPTRSTGRAQTTGGISVGAIIAGLVGAAVVITIGVWLLRRRRRPEGAGG